MRPPGYLLSGNACLLEEGFFVSSALSIPDLFPYRRVPIHAIIFGDLFQISSKYTPNAEGFKDWFTLSPEKIVLSADGGHLTWDGDRLFAIQVVRHGF